MWLAECMNLKDINLMAYDYDFYRKRIYGEYMNLPPEDQRNWHESEIIED